MAAQVYRRDATWKISHGLGTKWHWPRSSDKALSACGAVVLLDTGRDADAVPECGRCRRPGCAKRWGSVN